MNNKFFIKMAQREQNAFDRFSSAVMSASSDQLKDMSYDMGLSDKTPHLDDMNEKIAKVQNIGKELAKEYGHSLNKEAMIPALSAVLPAAGRIAAGLGGKAALKQVATGVAKDQAISGISNKLTSMRNSPQQASPSGTFKYANAVSAAAKLAPTLGQKATGFLVRNPGAALAGAGMVGGALMAPRDPQTGEKQYMRGALTGAALGTGAHMMGAGNKLRHAILNKSRPIAGEGMANYARQATRATAPTRPTTAARTQSTGAAQQSIPQTPLSREELHSLRNDIGANSPPAVGGWAQKANAGITPATAPVAGEFPNLPSPPRPNLDVTPIRSPQHPFTLARMGKFASHRGFKIAQARKY